MIPASDRRPEDQFSTGAEMAWYDQEPPPVLAPERLLTRRQTAMVVALGVALLAGALLFLIPSTTTRPLTVELPTIPAPSPAMTAPASVTDPAPSPALEAPRRKAVRKPLKARPKRQLTRVAAGAR